MAKKMVPGFMKPDKVAKGAGKAEKSGMPKSGSKKK